MKVRGRASDAPARRTVLGLELSKPTIFPLMTWKEMPKVNSFWSVMPWNRRTPLAPV